MIPRDMTEIEKYEDLKKIFTGSLISFNLYDEIEEKDMLYQYK